MLYLVIMVLVAAAGIARLWLLQRRESARLDSVDGFREGLQRIAGQQGAARDAARRRDGQRPARRPASTGAGVRPGPLDPARRDAAKRRIEARRRARQRVA